MTRITGSFPSTKCIHSKVPEWMVGHTDPTVNAIYSWLTNNLRYISQNTTDEIEKARIRLWLENKDEDLTFVKLKGTDAIQSKLRELKKYL